MFPGYLMITTCEVSRRFRACGRPGIAVCQYCERSFYSEHGDRLEADQEICHTKDCVRKKEDVIQHFAYQAVVGERNATQRCGQERYDIQPEGECSKCRGLFCASHVKEQDVVMRVGTTTRGSICAHCNKRRKLWARG